MGSSGFCGWMPIVAPERCAQVCDLSLPADLRKLAHDKLVAFNEVMVAHGFPASAKHILAERRNLPIQPFSRASAARKFFESGFFGCLMITSRASSHLRLSRCRRGPRQPMPPNIVVFFSDDHAGWALPSYGNSEISAPNLTHLSETGVLMRNAFTPCPVCSPARASFWTGLLPLAAWRSRSSRRRRPVEAQATDWLAGLPTLADHLQATPAIPPRSAASGIAARARRRSPASITGTAAGARRRNTSASPISTAIRAGWSKGAATTREIFTDAAVDFLRDARRKTRPFFLFIGYAATHNPWINRPERLVSQYRKASFRDIPDDMPYPFGRPGTHPSAPDDPP